MQEWEVTYSGVGGELGLQVLSYAGLGGDLCRTWRLVLQDLEVSWASQSSTMLDWEVTHAEMVGSRCS